MAEAYYETIDHVKLDKGILGACREAVAGVGDGRVSVDDAKKVFEKAADASKITDTERWTLSYCMVEFKWTEAAQHWFYEAVQKFDAATEPDAKKRKTEGTSYYATIDGIKCDRGILDACATAVEGKGDGRVSLDDAKQVWAKAADAGKVTKTERWTIRHCMTHFKFTEGALDFLKANLAAAVEEDK